MTITVTEGDNTYSVKKENSNIWRFLINGETTEWLVSEQDSLDTNTKEMIIHKEQGFKPVSDTILTNTMDEETLLVIADIIESDEFNYES